MENLSEPDQGLIKRFTHLSSFRKASIWEREVVTAVQKRLEKSSQSISENHANWSVTRFEADGYDTTLSAYCYPVRPSLTPPRQGLEQYTNNRDVDASLDTVQLHDAVARINHELWLACSEDGLINQTRKARVRERKARRKKARTDDTLQGTLKYLSSRISQITTANGVHLLPIGVLMSALFLGSASIYWWAGMNVQQNLYYSIVTFTTSPPSSS